MTNDLTDTLPRWCRITFVIAALAVLSIALRRDDLLTNKPLTEDGYYMLAVSRHLALGDGISVDGVQPTNGVQPLFTFLAAPAYWLAGGDRLLALRWVLLLHGLCFVGAAWLFGLVLRDLGAARGVARAEALRWIGSCAWLASGYLFLMAHNGLETGCLLLLYLAYWRFAQLHPLRGLPLAAAHGVWLGVIVLARIDATFFVTALCGLHLLRGEGPFAARLREAVVAGLVAVAVSSPWWIYNVAEFGALMPSSGAAQSGMVDPGDDVVMSRITEGLRNLLLVATPILYAGDGAGGFGFVLVRIAFLAAIAGILCWRRGAPVKGTLGATQGGAKSDQGRTVAAALLLTGAAFAVYYPVNFWATHFYSRYFIVLAPFGMAAFAIAALRVFHRPRRFDVLLPLALLACTGGLAVIVHTGVGFAGNQWLRDQVSLVRENVPPGARLAAGQSGTLGYFVDGVHNLDGKVNAAALRHQADMGVYLTEHRIEWLCDWPAYLHRYVDPRKLAAEWQLVAQRGEFELWRRR